MDIFFFLSVQYLRSISLPLPLAKAIPFSFRHHPPFTAQPQWPLIHGPCPPSFTGRHVAKPGQSDVLLPHTIWLSPLHLQIYIQISFLREAIAQHISKQGTPHLPHPNTLCHVTLLGFSLRQIPPNTNSYICLFADLLSLPLECQFHENKSLFFPLTPYQCPNSADQKH